MARGCRLAPGRSGSNGPLAGEDFDRACSSAAKPVQGPHGMSDERASLLKEFVAAFRTREAAAPLAAVIPTFCSAWTRWQEAVFLPRLRAVAATHPGVRDPAWSRGDELRVLDLSHENAYSDWFEWLLGATGPGAECLQTAIVEALCPAASPAPRFALIDRERVLTEGDEEQGGRLDVVLEAPAQRRAIVIEAKIRDPNQAELEKHVRYIDSFGEDHPDPWENQYVLLVPDVNALRNLELHDFTPAGWDRVTIVIRRLLRHGALDENPQLAAFASAFAAAVESRVLELPIAAWRALLVGHDLSHASVQALASSSLLDYLEAVDAG